eukprot:TRINITY_DN66983_c0_g1_i2.p2 TRINITY_DN66983_c0_g1~~TRINITY_DN66983_c0_g1_i2.p2  ORF type:complete len:214 (-),score=26.20 TRINITY_DN66983_c0_g1_i2:283-924(-)
MISGFNNKVSDQGVVRVKRGVIGKFVKNQSRTKKHTFVRCQIRVDEGNGYQFFGGIDPTSYNLKGVVNFGANKTSSWENLGRSIEKVDEVSAEMLQESSPGTGGKKQFPATIPATKEVEEQQFPQDKNHLCKSTKECYDEFPFLIRASCPLYVEDQEPNGKTLAKCGDAGPGTGKRRFPSQKEMIKDQQEHMRPNHLNTREDNLREVSTRRCC